MSLKSLAYRFVPKSLVAELRHWKHVRDLASTVEPEEAPVSKIILPGQTVLDIGANFGVFTKMFSALVGPQGSVMAFEPVPQTYRTLVAGVERLHLSNVQPLNKAVSDHVGQARMTVPQYADSNGENLYEARIIDEPDTKDAFTVETITVDSLQLSRVDFIKIDVEGHEFEVLRGSKETLQKHRPTLMIEVTCRETVDFLCEEMRYEQPVIVSPSNQLFVPRISWKPTLN